MSFDHEIAFLHHRLFLATYISAEAKLCVIIIVTGVKAFL